MSRRKQGTTTLRCRKTPVSRRKQRTTTSRCRKTPVSRVANKELRHRGVAKQHYYYPIALYTPLPSFLCCVTERSGSDVLFLWEKSRTVTERISAATSVTERCANLSNRSVKNRPRGYNILYIEYSPSIMLRFSDSFKSYGDRGDFVIEQRGRVVYLSPP